MKPRVRSKSRDEEKEEKKAETEPKKESMVNPFHARTQAVEKAKQEVEAKAKAAEAP